MRIPNLVSVIMIAAPMWAVSYYTVRLDDPKAVYVTPRDGVGIQKAIDKVQETTGQGIVFLPEGRYPIAKTAGHSRDRVWRPASRAGAGGQYVGVWRCGQ